MTPTWTWLCPLLLLIPLPSTAQTTTVPPAASGDPTCLSEILISTPQPYDEAQVADAQHKAESAREAIEQGAKFEDTAKKYSDGPTAAYGGPLGGFKRGQLSRSIEDKVFAMKTGDLSDVIRTKQGFIILKVTPCGLHPDTGAHRQSGSIEILSDTQGVDFGPYMQNIVQTVKTNWYSLIPESAQMKKGKVEIEFAIMKDGHVQGIFLQASTHDSALDRAAYGSITTSDPFPPLPAEFTGPYLSLRFRFYYNLDKVDLDKSDKDK